MPERHLGGEPRLDLLERLGPVGAVANHGEHAPWQAPEGQASRRFGLRLDDGSHWRAEWGVHRVNLAGDALVPFELERAVRSEHQRREDVERHARLPTEAAACQRDVGLTLPRVVGVDPESGDGTQGEFAGRPKEVSAAFRSLTKSR